MSLDNVTAGLHRPLCVCDVVLWRMIDEGKRLSSLLSGNALLYLYFVAGFISGTQELKLYTKLYLLLAQQFFFKDTVVVVVPYLRFVFLTFAQS